MDFQPLDIEFGELNTTDDPASLPPGTLVIADNASSQVGGIYAKRFGYTQAGAATKPASCVRLSTLGPELDAIDASGELWSFDSALNKWRDVGSLPAAQTAQLPVALDESKDIVGVARATANGIVVHAWILGGAGAGSVWVELQSLADGAIISRQLLDASVVWRQIHCVAAGTTVLVWFSSTAAQLLNFAAIDCAAGFVGASTNFKAGANVNAAIASFDVCPLTATTISIVWAGNAPNILACNFNASTLAGTAQQIVSAETASAGLGIVATQGESGYLGYHVGGGNCRAVIYNPATGAQTVAPFTVTGAGAAAGRNVTWARVDATHALFVDDRGAVPGVAKGFIETAVVSSAGVVTVPNTLFNVAIASKAFAFGGFIYANVYYGGAFQATYHTVRLDTGGLVPSAVPIAMHGYRTAFTLAPVIGQIYDVDQASAGRFWFSAPLAFKFLSTSTPRAAAFSFLSDFTSETRLLPTEIGTGCLFASGAVGAYDGNLTYDNNFLQFPEITSATPGAVGAAGMDNGTYAYIAIYESASLSGDVDRSTTSIGVSATTAAGAGLGKVTLMIDQLTLTRVRTVGSGIAKSGTISIFRTKAAGTTFFCIATVDMTPTAANITFVDQANDSTIGANRILYTAGGVLDREPALPALQLVVHRNRVWGISAADPKILFYSGEYQPGEAPWFSSFFQIRVDAGGPITAIASLDSNLIAFKADRIFFIYGDPLNALGQNSSLGTPQLITADCGNADPRAVGIVPQGLLFRSPKGMHILTRKLDTTYVPAPEGYLAQFAETSAAVMVAGSREARMELAAVGLATGMKIVFNYRDNRWTTHQNLTGRGAVSAVVANGVYCWADTAGDVYQESTATFLDPGATWVSMKLATAFIAPAGKQGLARVRKAMLLSRVKTFGFDLHVDVTTNYNPVTIVQPELVTDARIQATSTQTAGQIAVSLSQQKAEAYAFSFYDTPSGGAAGTGEAWAARGVRLLAGVKKGSFDKQMLAAAKG